MSMVYDNISSVERVFHEFGDPVWIFNSGKGKSTYPNNDSNRLFSQLDPGMHISESWDILRRQLELVLRRGGYGHIYQGSKERFINIPIWFPHASMNGAIDQGGGIGVAGFGGLPVGFREYLELERDRWELRRDLDELAQSRVGGFWDRVGESLISSEQLPVLINGLVGLLSKLGTGGAVTAPGVAGQTAPPVIPQSIQDREQDVKPASDFRQRISRHFRNESEMQQYLDIVATIFETDPEGMKAFLRQTIGKQ